MRNQSFIIICFIFSFIALSSCTKDFLAPEILKVEEQAKIEQLQKFYEVLVSQSNAKDLSALAMQAKPDWTQIHYSQLHREYIIEIPLSFVGKKSKYLINQFLVIAEKGKNLYAQFAYIIQDKNKLSSLMDLEQLRSVVVSNSNENKFSEGKPFMVIIQDLHIAQETIRRQGTFITRKLKPAQDAQRKVQGDSIDISNTYPIESCTENGGTIVTTDWYLVEFGPNGEILWSLYIETTQQCVGGGGGTTGGGGSGGSGQCIYT